MQIHLSKPWRIVLWSVFTPLLLASVAIAWLCYTAAGLQFALLQLNRVPNLQVQVQGVNGRLAGPLQVEHISLDHERIHIEIDALEVDFTPAYLLSGLIEINLLKAEQITAQLKPITRVGPDTPIHFLPTFLRISIDELQLQRAQYRHTSGYEITAQPLRARVDLSRSRLQLRDLNAVTRDFDARGEVSLDADAVLQLAANLDADYRIVNGPILRAHLNATGPLTGNRRELKLNALLREPHDAVFKGGLAFPDSGWHLQGDVQAARVLLDAWWPQPAFSLSQVNLQLDFSNAGMHYAGKAIVPEWSPVPLQIDAQTQYAERVFSIERADVSMPQSGVRTHTQGSITLQTDAKPRIAMRSTWRYLQWPLHVDKAMTWFSSEQGSLVLEGSQPYQFKFEGRVATPKLPDSVAQATGEISPGEIQIAHYDVQSLQAKASGNALLGLSTPRRWQIAVRGTDIDPAVLLSAWPGRLNIQAAAQGTGLDRNALFDLQLDQLRGSLRNLPVNAQGRLQHQRDARGDTWLADAVTAQWGRAQLTARGKVSRSAAGRGNGEAQNNLQWTLVAPALEQLHPDLDGDLNMQGAFSGSTDKPQLTLTARSTRFDYAQWQVRNLQLDTHVDVTDRSASQLELQADSVAQGNLTLQRVHFSGTGQTAAHTLTVQAMPVHALLPKDLQLTLQVQGGYADSIWRGTLEKLQADVQSTARMKLADSAPLLLSPQQVQLQSLCVLLDQGRGCATVDWSKDAQQNMAWSVKAQLQDLPLTVSNNAKLNPTRLQARVNGQLNLAATATTPWQGTGDLRFDDASIHYKLATNRDQVLPISQAEVHLNATAPAVHVNADLRMGEQTVATLITTLERRANIPMGNWPLSGVLGFSSSDAKLIPVFVNEVDRAAGTLAAVLELSGTANAPRMTGNLRLLNGELDFYQLNLALRALELNADVGSDQLRFTAQGNAGEGPLQASGDFSWRNDKLLGKLQLKGERLLVADLPEYRVLASPDLQFAIDDHNLDVKGEVLIPEARLQPKDVTGAVQTSADARFKTDQMLEPGSAWQVNSDINIRLGEAVNFDGLGLQGRLEGAVATRLRTGEVALGSGELSVVDGHYEIYGQKFDMKRGRLIYDNTPLTDPGLDIQAERRVTDTTKQTTFIVGVNVRGVLRAPRLQFYSDDSEKGQADIVSYLLMGRPLSNLQESDANTARSAAMQGGGLIASQLGRRIGLEEVGVETDKYNQSSLVLGKFLSPRLFISYGISLAEAVNTVKLRYTISDHWTLKTEAGEAKGADIEFKIEH